MMYKNGKYVYLHLLQNIEQTWWKWEKRIKEKQEKLTYSHDMTPIHSYYYYYDHQSLTYVLFTMLWLCHRMCSWWSLPFDKNLLFIMCWNIERRTYFIYICPLKCYKRPLTWLTHIHWRQMHIVPISIIIFCSLSFLIGGMGSCRHTDHIINSSPSYITEF